MDTPFLLGIDPGSETGLAGYVPDEGLVFVESAGPLDTLRRLTAWARSGLLLGAYVEDAPGLPIYARNRHANRGERDRIARSVVTVDGLTTLYLDALAGLDVPTVPVEPIRAAKWDAAQLRRVTGYDRRTNEHGRDAARHVYGRPRLTAQR